MAAVLFAASLAGCGGGSGDGGSATAAEAGSGGAGSLNGLKQKVSRLQAERRRQAKKGIGNGSGDGGTSASPSHSDSGGGAAQFRGEGDNSIQEFGQEASAAERETAAAALHGYLDAWAAHRWKQACFYMSAGVAVTLERMAALARQGTQGDSCPQLFAGLNRAADVKAVAAAAAAVDVGSLRVKGRRGFVLYHGAEGVDYSMPMAYEAGGWKVGALEGISLR
jgi:hypothetical protein